MTRTPARTVHLAIRGPIARADLPGLCGRVCELLERSGATDVRCDVRSIEPDAVTVDALARLQLAAQRHGCRVRLVHASDELVELVVFMGLRDVLPGDRYESSLAGSPKRGNSDSVSRKNVNSPIRPSDTSSTCSAHGS
jgi:ABC-type transporter Mla MlaB component